MGSSCVFFAGVTGDNGLYGSGAGSGSSMILLGVAGNMVVLKDEGVPSTAVSLLLMAGMPNSSPLS